VTLRVPGVRRYCVSCASSEQAPGICRCDYQASCCFVLPLRRSWGLVKRSRTHEGNVQGDVLDEVDQWHLRLLLPVPTKITERAVGSLRVIRNMWARLASAASTTFIAPLCFGIICLINVIGCCSTPVPQRCALDSSLIMRRTVNHPVPSAGVTA
jgi:hypothetical protein